MITGTKGKIYRPGMVAVFGDYLRELTFTSTESDTFVGGSEVEVPCAFPLNGGCTLVPYAWALRNVPEQVSPQRMARPDKYPGTEPYRRMRFNPKPDQESAVRKLRHLLVRQRTGILQAETGSGKSFMAINLCCELNLKPLILVENDQLISQWKKEILKFTYADASDVGIIKGKLAEHHKPWVIGSLRTLANRDNLDYADAFNIVIFDEVQTAGAPKTSTVMSLFRAPMLLGMSATPERPDGLWSVIKSWFGDILFEHKRQDTVPVTVYQQETGIHVPDNVCLHYGRIVKTWSEEYLSKRKSRNVMICKDVLENYQKGRDILLLAHRVEHLQLLRKMLKIIPDKHLFEFHNGRGKQSKDVRAEGLQKQVIFSTYKMFSKGISVDRLSVLFLATPPGNATQLKGRVDRTCDGKDSVVIYDYIDKGIAPEALRSSRERSYRKMQLEVTMKKPRVIRRVVKKAKPAVAKKPETQVEEEAPKTVVKRKKKVVKKAAPVAKKAPPKKAPTKTKVTVKQTSGEANQRKLYQAKVVSEFSELFPQEPAETDGTSARFGIKERLNLLDYEGREFEIAVEVPCMREELDDTLEKLVIGVISKAKELVDITDEEVSNKDAMK